MPIGYLVTVALVASGTALALSPPRQPRVLARNWFSSIVINELPLVVIVGLLAATLLAIAEGDIDSPEAGVLVGLAGLTMIGLAVLARRGARTRQTLDDALRDGLGPGWRTTVDSGIAAGLRRRRPLARILLAPFPWLGRPGAIERVANVGYGPAGRRNRLDVYRHRAHPSGAPTLIYMHGGGYFSGRKSREARPLLHRLASQGWVCISANYRLNLEPPNWGAVGS